MWEPTLSQSAVSRSSIALFARNFFRYPSMLGSIVPSSRFLVNDLLSRIDWEGARVIVEFGPGVGTMTREMLQLMRRDAVLVVIELNAEFVDYLKETIRDPRLRIIHGSAVDVRRILAEQEIDAADYVISGLPYSLLSESMRQAIVAESRLALRPSGSLLVFQFNRKLLPYLKSSFKSVRQNFQLFNILPALIFDCRP